MITRRLDGYVSKLDCIIRLVLIYRSRASRVGEIVIVTLTQTLLNTERVRCVAASRKIILQTERAHAIAVNISTEAIDLSAADGRLFHEQRATAEIAKNRMIRVEFEIRLFCLLLWSHRHVSAARVVAPLLQAPRLGA